MTIPQAFELALQHHRAGRLADAEALYRQILAAQPNHAGALHFLGVIAYDFGRNDLAVDLIRRSIGFDPNNCVAYFNLGEAWRAAGRLEEAIAAYRQALRINPDFPHACNNLGIALGERGQLDEAIAVYRSALQIRPGFAEIHNNMGNALREQGKFGEAVVACRSALELQPDFPEAHNNLAAAHAGLGQIDEAIAAYRRALELKPQYPEAHNNLGAALAEHGRLAEAVAAYRRALELKPLYAEAHYNLGVALLAQGDFLRGWEECEWRWKFKDAASPPRAFTQLPWDGSPLEGRTLLLHAEQGFGDAIQFIRYLPLAAQRGGKIILECPPELQRLFQTMASDLPIVARGGTLPAFDAHCPLLSLPRVFSTDLSNIPGTVPYLRADPAAAATWRERLDGHGSSLKVGLVWASSPSFKHDRKRSLRLASLAPLADVPAVQFYSLQKGAAAAEASAPPTGMELIDLAEELKDFADTAALVANLDLVIAVDTSVAHLAGAMGKPVWTLLSFIPDWRWLLDRSDTPWYPTMRLFRQPRLTDWAPVIADLVAQLQLLAQSPRSKL